MSDKEPKSPSSSEHENDVRCACGALMARQVPGGIELRCRRCKRTTVVDLEGANGAVG